MEATKYMGLDYVCDYSIVITTKINWNCDARNDAKFHNDLPDPKIPLNLNQRQLYT